MIPEVILASLIWSVVQLNAVDVVHRLDRLMVVGRVLYVAAHPDDENTQLLSYLTHAQHVRTAYLSLTRGDGGQNLVGSEQSPLLGVIRSHELMEARKVDGAEQLFTRARDFGYSKRSDEALEVWGKDATLGDVVWAVRRFRPHVIITRFPESGDTHGHHLASAILAREAFSASADASRFPEQLDRAATWQAKRLIYNVPNRFMPQEARPDDLVVDIGGFDAVSGLSYGEIAAASRSMHKSQGFGAARKFGPEPERFRHLEGEPARGDLFDGVDLGWSSIEGGEAVASALQAARDAFRPNAPSVIAPHLSRALEAVSKLADSSVKSWAQREIGMLLIGATGLLLEARAEQASVVPGATLPVKVMALRRGDDAGVSVRWTGLQIGETQSEVDVALEHHAPVERSLSATIASDAALSTLPWLSEQPGPGRYRGEGDSDVPLPPPSLRAALTLEIAGAVLSVEVPVRRYTTDPVKGEITRDIEILPGVTATPAARAVLVPCAGAAERCETKLRVALRAREPGRLEVQLPEGYRATPSSLDVKEDGEVVVTIHAEAGAKPGTMRLMTSAGGRQWNLAERALSHDHVPERTVLLPAEVEVGVVRLDVPDTRIGHIPGPGDEVADNLRRVGFDVVDLDGDDLAHGDLSRFGAILTGVRAFNTNEALRKHHARLFAFAEAGGTVLVQYATKSRREALDVPLLPYPMTLGRGRVTDETAAVELLAPDHPLLRHPHEIGADDFRGWVQERGLYFGESWDEQHVTPLLAMADPGAPTEKGSLLAADHGAGRVIYVGLALFRQLPAGVPGAYRLTANLLARRDGAARPASDEPPPVLGRWRNLYLVVLVILTLLIGAFFLLKRRYGS